jgi:hypothetical protein
MVNAMRNSAIVLFIVGLFLAACSTQGPSDSAQQLTYSELTTTPGYAWFQAEMAAYTPNASMVDSVRAHYNASEQKVCVFVKPSCSCTGTRRLFPRTVKTLQAAGVDMNSVEFWSMRTSADKQPYDPGVSIKALPTIVVMRNGVQSGRIEETDFTDTNADTLIAQAIAH